MLEFQIIKISFPIFLPFGERCDIKHEIPYVVRKPIWGFGGCVGENSQRNSNYLKIECLPEQMYKE